MAKAKVTITRPVKGNTEVLTREALSFLASLEVRYGPERRRLLAARADWQAGFEKGDNRAITSLDSPPTVHHALKADTPAQTCIEFLTTVSQTALETAQAANVDRVIADFEDATAPRFETMLGGQLNLKAFDAAKTDTAPELAIRPRGLHLDEAHLLIKDAPISAALFDVGLYLFHATQQTTRPNTAPQADTPDGEEAPTEPPVEIATETKAAPSPFVYLPKLEHPAEAKLWADIFRYCETRLGMEPHTIRAGVYVETLAGVLQLEGIIAELADYISGLTTGKWDYVFSWAMAMQDADGFNLPDRTTITDDTPLMAAYAAHILHMGQKYALPVTGGVSSVQINTNDTLDPAILAPRSHEAKLGFVGASVAFPELAAPIRAIFDDETASQTPAATSLEALLSIPQGPKTLACARANLTLLTAYTTQWMDGVGSPIIEGRMVYLAAVEIARVQLWLWLNGEVVLDGVDGENHVCDEAWLDAALATEKSENSASDAVINLVRDALTADPAPKHFADFAYETLVNNAR